MTGEFPAQRASDAENVSIWWRHQIIFEWRQHKCAPAESLLARETSRKTCQNCGQYLCRWPSMLGAWASAHTLMAKVYIQALEDLILVAMVCYCSNISTFRSLQKNCGKREQSLPRSNAVWSFADYFAISGATWLIQRIFVAIGWELCWASKSRLAARACESFFQQPSVSTLQLSRWRAARASILEWARAAITRMWRVFLSSVWAGESLEPRDQWLWLWWYLWFCGRARVFGRGVRRPQEGFTSCMTSRQSVV